MKRYSTLPVVFLAFLAYSNAEAEFLKDPRLRDENISATEFVFDVSVNSSDHYVYRYDVKSALTNRGHIRSVSIDIGCDERIDSSGFDAKDYPSDARRSFSEDGKHVPVAVDAPWGQAAAFGIGAKNTVSWSVALKPGEARTGLTLISPYPPGPREYRLIPSIRVNEHQWDYSGIKEDDPEVPWIEDWTVTGVTTGPACPGEEYPNGGVPKDGVPNERFSGSSHWGQSKELNQLLTYSQPLRDQFHLEPGTREFEMTIHYGEAIDPRTFRITPQRNQLRRLFNPEPGTSEAVRIPLEPGKNRIELQVQTRSMPPGQGEQPPQAVQGRDGVPMDRDVFVIRVQSDEPDSGRANALGRGQGAPERP